MGLARALAILWALAAVAACGSGRDDDPPPSPPPYQLQAVGGTYDDGSGRLGVALLATLRDGAGQGPASAWTGSLADGSGPRSAIITYGDPGAGSFEALWWPELPFSSGDWSLSLVSEGATNTAPLVASDTGRLSPPAVSLTPDGATLEWNDVPGAASYECRITSGSGLVRAGLQLTTGCGVGDLPEGGYSATVLAFSTDLDALRLDASQRPALPSRFDVSEGRLSFLRADGAPATTVAVAGGSMDIGLGSPTLAFWMSILRADGTPSPAAWSITVTGPELPETSPITFTYPPNFPRLVQWSYDQPAAPGRYTLVATSVEGTLAATFSVGASTELGMPSDVIATDGALGSARVDWALVPGARSYLVSVWQGAEFVTSQWASGPPANIPQGSFTAGQLYDVYVAATDVDMIAGTRPSQIAVTENTLQPAGFVAR